MAEAANVSEVAAEEKPKARRAAPRRAAASKGASKTSKSSAKPTAKKASKAKKADTEGRLQKVKETAKKAALVQLGIYGRAYDGANERVSKVRKEASKQWDQLAKRGEKVRNDIDKAQKDMSNKLRDRVDSIEIPAPIENGVEKFRSAVRKLTDRVRKAA